MSKVVEATCVAGIVKVGALPVPTATILSEGVAASSGILVLDEDKATYIAKVSTDLKDALDQLSSALGSLTTALTTLDVKVQPTTCPAGAGVTVTTPLATASITSITSAKAAIDLLKEALK